MQRLLEDGPWSKMWGHCHALQAQGRRKGEWAGSHLMTDFLMLSCKWNTYTCMSSAWSLPWESIHIIQHKSVEHLLAPENAFAITCWKSLHTAIHCSATLFIGKCMYITTCPNLFTGGVLPVLAQQWWPAVWWVQCGPAGRGGAGGTHYQDTQHHPLHGIEYNQLLHAWVEDHGTKAIDSVELGFGFNNAKFF